MPTRAPRPCRHHSCRVLVRTGNYCELHRRERDRGISPARAEAFDFYSSSRWRTFRAQVLGESPWCIECWKRGQRVRATDVDHIIRRRLRPDLAFVRSNAQSLCHSCHSTKTRSGH